MYEKYTFDQTEKIKYTPKSIIVVDALVIITILTPLTTITTITTITVIITVLPWKQAPKVTQVEWEETP